MAVTDLTNTIWEFDETLIFTDSGNYNINFVSNSVTNVAISFIYFSRQGDIVRTINYSGVSNDVYDLSTGWLAEAYRTIEITGGTDVTNATLISWLEANATQILPTAKTVINGLTPIKKMFGTTEIVKEVVNGVTVYEKQATGYSGNITAYNLGGSGGDPSRTYIKFGSAPTSASDYNARSYSSGRFEGDTSYTNQTKAYIWSGSDSLGGAIINDVTTRCNYTTYDNAVEITLTGNYEIKLICSQNIG